MATRPVLRIFISSTAVDLIDYREKVRDAVLRLENLPIAMETFSAKSGQPTQECMRMAAEADAVICVVAHRYGYVPPPELGGDGERSITWLEVDAAKRAGKPVFAFLVDPNAPWTEVKEQDRVTSEPPEKAAHRLQEFKAYLEREFTRQTFKNPDDLAAHVTAALATFASKPGQAPSHVARVWRPLFCHGLQPAQHFRGRQAKLQELKDWLEARVTPDRVVSVVAAGGTGKTALVDKAIHEATLSDSAGVFIWSFYEEPHMDAFLRAAYLYFTGERDTPTGGMLERLQLALSGNLPHVLVLDGIECLQNQEGLRRGEFEDLQLKRLLRALASGEGKSAAVTIDGARIQTRGWQSARALVTSRYPLVDLEDWTGAGHRAIVLDDLECPVALEVLRAWKVKGEDAELVELIEPLNMGGLYHALSVAALGSYVANFTGGDPSRAPDFSPEDAKDSDPKVRRLHRILEQYAKALTAAERDLLARLSLFPRGVNVELLGWIARSHRRVAGALKGLEDHQLVTHLERLKALGLVFCYETDRRAVYSAHPFLRDFFRNCLGTKPEYVHNAVRERLAPSLEARPSVWPTAPAVLDRYELLIEQTLLGESVRRAFDLYQFGLGGYRNLGPALGENTRGLRILERFVSRGVSSHVDRFLSLRQRSQLVNALGLFARNLGDLARARNAFEHSRGLDADSADPENESQDTQNLANIELNSGHFRQALYYAESAVSLAMKARAKNHATDAFTYRAIAHFALGEIAAATADFQRATELEGEPLYSGRGICEAEGKLLCGDRLGAISQTLANWEYSREYKRYDDLCLCHALLARLALPDDSAQACHCLQDARAFASSSGQVDLQLQCFRSACELFRHLGDYPQAITEGEAGILLADTCGFGKYSIDLRLALAETYLAAGDARKALQNARNAIERSEDKDCQYAWGKADGLHFCGLAHWRLGERELARERLTAALELRERLGHGRVEETRRALEQL